MKVVLCLFHYFSLLFSASSTPFLYHDYMMITLGPSSHPYTFYLIPSDRLPITMFSTSNYLPLNTTQVFEYSAVEYNYMTSPYITDCHDYPQQTQYDSREDCLRMCRLNNSLSECGLIPPIVDLLVGKETDIYVHHKSANFSKDPCIKRLRLTVRCEQVCPKMDCHVKQYKLQMPYNHDGSAYADKGTRLMIFISPWATDVHKQMAKTLWTDLVSALAGIFSLMFGSSATTLTNNVLFYLFENYEKIIESIGRIISRIRSYLRNDVNTRRRQLFIMRSAVVHSSSKT